MKLIEQHTMFAIALAAAVDESFPIAEENKTHLNYIWTFAKKFRDDYVFSNKSINDDDLFQLLIDTSESFFKLVKKRLGVVKRLKNDVSAARLKIGKIDNVYSKIITSITELTAVYETCTPTSLNAIRTSIADDVVEHRVNATRVLSDLSTLLEKAKHEQSNLPKL